VYSGLTGDGVGTEVLAGDGAVVLMPGMPVVTLTVGAGTGVGYRHCNILQHKSDGSETIWQDGGGTTPSSAGHLWII
jgi:hypothetical protein